MKPIYFVTAIASKERAYRSRCWAWYPNLLGASKAALRNDGDMHELTYDYLVIEKLSSGVMQIAEQVKWYHWVKGAWKLCDTPKFSKSIVNWCIG